MKDHGHLYSGFVIMTIGILLMLGNLGIITWSVLSGFSQIWPLIIVAVGLNLFFNNHVLIKMITFTGLVIALVVAGMVYPKTDTWDIRFDFDGINLGVPTRNQAVAKVYPNEQNISSAELNLKMPAGSLQVSAQSEDLMTAKIPGSFAKESAITTDGGTRKVFTVDGGPFTLSNRMNSDEDWEYRFGLSSSIPWDLRIDTGATDANLDFSEIILKNLELNSGAGDIDLRIGKIERKAVVAADVKASDFKVRLPEGVGFKAIIRGAIHDVSIEGSKYTQEGNVYTSDNYGSAAQKVDLNLDVAVGDIQIEFE